MFRTAPRVIARSSALRAVPRAAVGPTRRSLSTAPPSQKSRSWKSLAGRLGIAGAVIYYYNTTDVFAEEPRHAVHTLPETEEETEQLPTIDALAKERHERKAQAAAAEKAANESAQEVAAVGGVEGLEEEADQQGAFNPETGEINWDCPCLGGMAYGPCGEEFRAAFSCFVYSTEEPKGMDCIEKFKGMQNCFREYPEIYGSELEPDEEEDVTAGSDQPLVAAETDPSKPILESESNISADKTGLVEQKESRSLGTTLEGKKENVKSAVEQVKKDEPLSESDKIVPKQAHDETAANEAK